MILIIEFDEVDDLSDEQEQALADQVESLLDFHICDFPLDIDTTHQLVESMMGIVLQALISSIPKQTSTRDQFTTHVDVYSNKIVLSIIKTEWISW